MASAVVTGCEGEYNPAEFADDEATEGKIELGSATEAVSACAGDDVNYDFNAFAASLAVAVANELGRWDVTGDFRVINGKLELSPMGQLHCNGQCNNINALLRLQDDSASIVPNHSPAVFRSKLTTWYQQQQTKLTELVNNMLYVDKGIFKLKVRHSGKYLAVDAGSTAENAVIEQRGSVSQTGADQWRIILDNGAYKFVNVRSGKCLALGSDVGDNWLRMVQKTCSTSNTQRFNFALTKGYHWIITKYSKAIEVDYWKAEDDAPIQQFDWNSQNTNQQWTFEPYGTGPHITPTTIATAMYTLTSRKSGKALTIDNGSLADGALVEQATYSATDDGFNWYVLPNGAKYQIVNRRTQKCMALAADTATSRFAQQPCNATASTQLFDLNPTGDGNYVVITKYGTLLQIEGASTAEGAYLNQAESEYADKLGGPWDWDDYKQLILKPIVAGEPHRLTYAYKTADAACGEYNYWYNIAKPNGQSLLSPQDTFVQLIFAGGKQTATGKDVNPFIAQKVSGNLVSIDPTYGLNADSSAQVGACAASCVMYSTANATGNCCSCNGSTKRFARSPFSASMFVCN